MPIRGIIFDLDGTLLDTLGDIAAAVNAGRRAMGLPEWPVSDIKQWIGEGMPILCQRALIDAPHVPVEQMLPIVSEYYAAHRLDQAAPYPGIPELLDALTARGIPMAILSNKPHVHTLPMAQAVFAKWSFVAIEGYRLEEFRKPDPRGALQIAATMQAAPADVALVGDSDTDMRTAVNAGMVPVGATWGYRSRDVILAAGARHLIDTPAEILDLLDT
ncbi:MAG TPA: HAD family hydrolase [Phycisphaerae bacterium]|nr:HAD family hydrolase [Phycisphaerae bacterium]HOM53710.1 HAD family hydrolase [Phycisphaerae bacterium]HOQ87230.1 HAD family hydrolase [Phycisphaerae bacterium]HPP29084.1 HAD family hydrolase [Phycisphaerae bacterium]HPU27892.1 HAD family hydrolase [Phycisphaerae bacterium]